MNFHKLILLIACVCSSTQAATYYVDAKNGNDNWSGKKSSISGTNGPWQSITKVNSAVLNPGDKILFSCGQTWYEPLKPRSSGTLSAKIYIGSYPVSCENKPKISGNKYIPSYSWQPYQGNIWKATFPQNLIQNSSLSSSVTNWSRWPSDANITFSATCPLSKSGCMNFLAGTSTNTSLAISNIFPVIGGQKYAATLSFYAPTGTSIKLILRENISPYRTLGQSKKIAANSQWQEVSFTFIPTQTITNARLDIEAPKTKRIYIRSANLEESGTLPKPSMVLVNNDPINIAHHPNAGHDTANPESVYFNTTTASPTYENAQGQTVSSQIIVPDLQLPSGGNVGFGTKLILREINFHIDNHTVVAVDQNMLSITPETRYPITPAGWGFYFYDELWMLDSAGEWFFDDAIQTLYLWAIDNGIPGNKVSLATIDTAIDLSSKSNLTVENLEIDGASTAINLANSTNVTIQFLNVHNIDGKAIVAANSANPTITNNRFNRVSASGVAAIDAQNSSQAVIENNELSEAGVFVKAGKRISLPMTKKYGIMGGSGSTIANNSVSDIGGAGILAQEDNLIDSNTIQRACYNINDCGTIYTSSPGTLIQKNLVLDTLGDLNGVPPSYGKHVTGIYLDLGVQGISVKDNTVKGSTHSIQLHNSGNNIISGNILYGSEERLLRQNEDIKLSAAISGNIVTNNQFFPTGNSAPIFNLSGQRNDLSNFATYSGNHYSNIYSSVITSEQSLSYYNDYTFPQWQTAKTISGIARNNDLDGDIPAPLTTFAQGLVGNNFMPNGNFSSSYAGWGFYNSEPSSVSLILEGCLPVSINCLRADSTASNSMVYSPKFAVTNGRFYRVTFDVKATVAKAVLYPRIYLAGPKYDDISQTFKYSPPNYLSSTNWERHAFIFQATATAAAPNLARFGISGIPTGQLWLANVEIATFDPGILGAPTSELLVNISDIDKAVDCPTRTSNPGLCSNYVTFPEGTVATWPISVSPRSGRIVFTQNLTLADSDGDSIADSQDDCPQTAKGQTVNGDGCSLSD